MYNRPLVFTDSSRKPGVLWWKKMADTTKPESALKPPSVHDGSDSTLKLDSAEECLRVGLFLWDAERTEQEETCARLLATPEQVSLMDHEGYRAGFLCFQT